MSGDPVERPTNTPTAIRLRPRWWQIIRRFREWRERRALIGCTLEFYDHSSGETSHLRIVDWSRDSLVTVARTEEPEK